MSLPLTLKANITQIDPFSRNVLQLFADFFPQKLTDFQLTTHTRGNLYVTEARILVKTNSRIEFDILVPLSQKGFEVSGPIICQEKLLNDVLVNIEVIVREGILQEIHYFDADRKEKFSLIFHCNQDKMSYKEYQGEDVYKEPISHIGRLYYDYYMEMLSHAIPENCLKFP